MVYRLIVPVPDGSLCPLPTVKLFTEAGATVSWLLTIVPKVVAAMFASVIVWPATGVPVIVMVATTPSLMVVAPPAPTVPVGLSLRLTPAIMARHPLLIAVALGLGTYAAGRVVVESSLEAVVAELPSAIVTLEVLSPVPRAKSNCNPAIWF